MTFRNGRLPNSVLVPIPTSPGEYIHKDIAYALGETCAEFESVFGKPLRVTEGYRTYRRQQYLFRLLGYPRANYPGQSDHGYGTACDFASNVNIHNSAEWRWMNTRGRAYGWRPLNERNLKFEPWHWNNLGTYQNIGDWLDVATKSEVQEAFTQALKPVVARLDSLEAYLRVRVNSNSADTLNELREIRNHLGTRLNSNSADILNLLRNRLGD